MNIQSELDKLLPRICYNEYGFIQFDCLLFIYPPNWYYPDDT